MTSNREIEDVMYPVPQTGNSNHGNVIKVREQLLFHQKQTEKRKSFILLFMTIEIYNNQAPETPSELAALSMTSFLLLWKSAQPLHS